MADLQFKKSGANDANILNIISKFDGLSKESKIELVALLADELKKIGMSEHEIFSKKEICIPIGIFANDSLGSLEAIVKYLREELKLGFSKIAKLLNRSSKTIWATYHNAVKKMPHPFGSVSKDILIPAPSFANRSFSTLECIVGFIKELGHSNHETALMLHLDDRTIWAVYDKIKKKSGAKS